MAAARRSAPIHMLKGSVDLHPLTGEPAGQGWTGIECASKKAYGCGQHAQKALQGLRLYVRLGDCSLAVSSLAIRMSDESLRAFKLGVDELPGPGKMCALGSILMAEQDLIVILLNFDFSRGDDLFYFLVYDNVDASLSMLSYLPDLYRAASATLLIPKRTVRGGCELLLMARHRQFFDLPPVLCVFSPTTDQANPWEVKGWRFPPGNIREPFITDAAFSFQGKGYWADLAQGLVCCDLCSATRKSVVDFGFIDLPRGCRLDLEQTLELRDNPKNLTRTMSCVNNSIWLVCIDSTVEFAHDLVTMWTLLPGGQWKKEAEISATEIWGLEGFKEGGLPQAAPEFPTFIADGSLCIVLTEQSQSSANGPLVGHICSIDVLNKRLPWHGLVHNYPFIKPVIFHSNFFQRSMVNTKRKSGHQRPAAGIASLAMANGDRKHYHGHMVHRL